VFGYLWAIAQSIAGILLNVFAFAGGVLPPGYFMFFPPFALMRAIFVVTHVQFLISFSSSSSFRRITIAT